MDRTDPAHEHAQERDQLAEEILGLCSLQIGEPPQQAAWIEYGVDRREMRAEGRDVVVGIVETHGRSETASLLEGLETLPLKELPHKDRALTEFETKKSDELVKLEAGEIFSIEEKELTSCDR